MSSSRLTSLSLSFNGIGDEGAIILGMGLVGSALTCLNLRKNGIHDAGASILSTSLFGSALTNLDLSANELSWEVKGTLAQLLVAQGIKLTIY